jgi:selenocysteine lyase/cysteine desulfurase
VPFDLKRNHADFVVADGHKWMLGPEGVALLYVDPRRRPQIRLHQYGWHMVEHPGDYDRKDWSPAPTATRYECGSPNLLGIHALEASLSLLLGLGIGAVEGLIRERTGLLIELIDRRGFELLSPRQATRRAGIVTFRVPGCDPGALHRGLMERGVICAQRGGGIRFSPHYHTEEAVLERAAGTAAEVAARLT